MSEKIKLRLQAIMMILNDPASSAGERNNAKQLIDKLCNKYQIDIDALFDEQTEERKYTYKTNIEKQLLLQLLSVVINKNEVKYRRFKSSRTLLFDLTIAQHIELTTMYEHYRSTLKDAIDDLISAFFISNNLFADDDSNTTDDIDWDRVERLLNLSSGIKPSSPHKQIELT